MSNKNQIYLAGLAMYVVAGLAGYAIDAYWIILIASLLIAGFTSYKVFKENREELFDSTKIDWISILSFAAIELVLTICITLLKLPLTGVVGYLNLFAQIMGYVFIGYSVIRYTLEHVTFHKELIERANSKKTTTIILEETPTTTKVAEEVKEVIKQEEPTVHEVEVVEEATEPEIKSIALKVDTETEVPTPYMEEEI